MPENNARIRLVLNLRSSYAHTITSRRPKGSRLLSSRFDHALALHKLCGLQTTGSGLTVVPRSAHGPSKHKTHHAKRAGGHSEFLSGHRGLRTLPHDARLMQSIASKKAHHDTAFKPPILLEAAS